MSYHNRPYRSAEMPLGNFIDSFLPSCPIRTLAMAGVGVLAAQSSDTFISNGGKILVMISFLAMYKINQASTTGKDYGKGN